MIKKKVGLILGLGAAIIIFILAAITLTTSKNTPHPTASVTATIEDTIPCEPTIEYGIITDSFIVYKDVIRPNQFLANILLGYSVPYNKIDQLSKQSKDVFDVRKIGAGKNYTVLCSNDSLGEAQCFIYEPNATDYVVFDFRDSLVVYRGKKSVTTALKKVSGVINSSLYQTLADDGINTVLAIEMANVFAWTIDFYQIQKGDWFKVVYEERSIDGKPIGMGKIITANFNHYNNDYFAGYFEQDSVGDYFDDKASSLRRAFLKSPLKFGRLTSRYSMRRFHPVQKRNKPHLGTDYAAGYGTPIMATGEGIVTKSAYKSANGNYVKIKHNSMYSTQYLHMQKRAVKVGQHVNQGETIGYVGSTGLATGPHVCYRFWKFGKQINHLNEDFPPSEPVKEENMKAFNIQLKKYQTMLGGIPLKETPDNYSVTE